MEAWIWLRTVKNYETWLCHSFRLLKPCFRGSRGHKRPASHPVTQARYPALSQVGLIPISKSYGLISPLEPLLCFGVWSSSLLAVWRQVLPVLSLCLPCLLHWLLQPSGRWGRCWSRHSGSSWKTARPARIPYCRDSGLKQYKITNPLFSGLNVQKESAWAKTKLCFWSFGRTSSCFFQHLGAAHPCGWWHTLHLQWAARCLPLWATMTHFLLSSTNLGTLWLHCIIHPDDTAF